MTDTLEAKESDLEDNPAILVEHIAYEATFGDGVTPAAHDQFNDALRKMIRGVIKAELEEYGIRAD